MAYSNKPENLIQINSMSGLRLKCFSHWKFITLIYLNRKYVNEHRTHTHTHKHIFLLKTVSEGQPNRPHFSLQIYLFIESEIKVRGHRIFK